MDRRDFLKNGSLTGLSFTALAMAGCRSASDSAVGASSGNPGEMATAFALNEVTIDALQQKMQKGDYTSRAITELYLQRIAAIDKKGPALHAVIEVNPDALAIADERDKERKAGKIRGPLHGIPVLIKDNIDTGDKMMTTAGSLALEGHKAAQDAFIVKQLRAAGAVLLGKTNLSEWANFRSERSTSGWSSRGGQTRCPYILDRNPSGSSAGSGAAVAANLCVIAIGTETNGSDRFHLPPCNGLVGIKPTVGPGEPERHHSHLRYAGYGGPHGANGKRCRHITGRIDGRGLAGTLSLGRSKGHFIRRLYGFSCRRRIEGEKNWQ